MRAVIVVLLASLGLAACSEQQTAKWQQDASAAIGGVHKVVADSSAPIGVLKQQASAAAGKLKQDASSALGVAKRVGDAAAVLDPELGQQIDEAKQQIDAVKEVAGVLQGK